MSFLGERGVDGGGPRREFFMLLMGCIGSILDGPPERRVLRHNTTAFEVCERVCFIPRMRFWQNYCFVHFTRWPRSSFFAPCVTDYLFEGISGVKPCVQDVPERDVQSKVSSSL